MPSNSISTVIVGPHKLLRAGISFLIEEFSFNVVATFGSVDDARQDRFENRDPELVLICIQSMEGALKELVRVREQWISCKIVFLFEQMAPQQIQLLGQASIDGCIPLHVSRELLVRTLKLIVLGGARIFIHDGFSGSSAFRKEMWGDTQADQSHLKNRTIDDLKSMAMAVEQDPPLGAEQSEELSLRFNPVKFNHRAPVQSSQFPTLSGREETILDGLVKGYSNKQIARECGITEATVKVHMKSILRKLQVSNRTQAAIWARDRRADPTSSLG